MRCFSYSFITPYLGERFDIEPRSPPHFFKRLSKSLGPGIITGAADDDPAGIATYSIAGAQLGTSLLWTAWLTWPLMFAVQMMCARIGMVTGQGLAAALSNKIPRPLLIVAAIALLIANTLNIGADLSAMADAAEMVTGYRSLYFLLVFAVGISLATVHLSYSSIANTLKWLALTLFTYIIVTFIIGPHWRDVAHDAFIPSLPKESPGWATLVAILGTTISPYLFFWQASLEVEEEISLGLNTIAKRTHASVNELGDRKIDIGLGTFISNLVMFFIILATALTLHKNGITNIETSRQAADALRPLAGRFAALLYSLGLIGVGLLAIPTLTTSSAYALSEIFKWKHGLYKKFLKAKYFYVVIILSTSFGMALDLIRISPVKALYWSAIANGLLAPFLLVGILLVAADARIMKGQPSSNLSLYVVAFTTAIMFVAIIAMFVV
ncbi:MAG: hypothetical protein JWQ35_2423 [Bacteriovoracaceae bacterium]|nr:hypothetical protein [Bacteriovoracaceae bacterium]